MPDGAARDARDVPGALLGNRNDAIAAKSCRPRATSCGPIPKPTALETLWAPTASALPVTTAETSRLLHRRNTIHLIAQYMHTASQVPATRRDSWYCTPRAANPLVTPRMNAR